MPIESGLPLGLIADAAYTESDLDFGPGDRLTLITDGVVEARNGQGELFGFERAADLQIRQAIADAANAFGQDDDITVVTIARETVGEPLTERKSNGPGGRRRPVIMFSFSLAGIDLAPGLVREMQAAQLNRLSPVAVERILIIAQSTAVVSQVSKSRPGAPRILFLVRRTPGFPPPMSETLGMGSLDFRQSIGLEAGALPRLFWLPCFLRR